MAALLIVTIVAAVLASALETALLCLREHHVVSLTKKDTPLQKKVLSIARHPRQSLNQILILSSIANLNLAVLGLFFLRESGLSISNRPILTAVILFGSLILIVDLLPKMIALSQPGRVFRITVTPFIFIGKFINPIVDQLVRFTDWMSRKLGFKSDLPANGLNEDELETLIDMKRDEGVLRESESELIHEIIKIGKKTAKDCMTPRIDAFLLSIDSEKKVMLDKVRQSGHWEAPVYNQTPDVITGILDIRSWLQHPDSSFQDFVRPPVFVPETMMALEVMKRYLHHTHALVIVVDEYGGVEGVLSHTDVVEEIIGDSAPLPEQAPAIQDLGNGQLLVSGNARLDAIGQKLELNLEADGLDTIGGLIFNQIGELPALGTQIDLRKTSIVVRKCRGNRITEVIVWKRDSMKNGDTPSASNEKQNR